jgi:hypothetical protein
MEKNELKRLLKEVLEEEFLAHEKRLLSELRKDFDALQSDLGDNCLIGGGKK